CQAMRLPAVASIVATPSATLPVAGTVHNTNTLLGHDGFVGVKTGSDDAAGGCFAFRAIRWIDGERTTITGVVLGQPGHNQIAAGPAAADPMVGRLARSSGYVRSTTHAGTANYAPRPSTMAARPCPPPGVNAIGRPGGETLSRSLRPPANGSSGRDSAGAPLGMFWGAPSSPRS